MITNFISKMKILLSFPNFRHKNVLTIYSTLAFASLSIGCSKDKNDGSNLSDKIQGSVVEDYTGNLVPFAYVGVQMEKWINQWNSELTIVDTIQADNEGRFQLDRTKYHQLDEANGAVSFFACADGPDLNGVDVYSDNCAEGGTLIYPNEQQDVVCKVYTIGWIRFFIEDLSPLNNEITDVAIHELWPGGNGFGYPFGYDPNVGYILEVTGYRQYEVHVSLYTWSDGIDSNDSELEFTTFSVGKDTTDIIIQY